MYFDPRQKKGVGVFSAEMPHQPLTAYPNEREAIVFLWGSRFPSESVQPLVQWQFWKNFVIEL